MRKNFLAAITFAMVLVSCTSTNEELAGLEAVSTNASEEITTYVSNNFPDTKIVSAVTKNGIVTAELNTGEELTFSTAGVYRAYSNNASTGLSADSLIITTDTIHNDSVRSGRHGGGKHGDKGGKGGGKHGDKGGKGGKNDSTSHRGHDRHFDNEIAIDSLTAEISTYIATNYSGYTVLHAEIDTICEGTVTEVMVSLASAQPVKLVFDSANAYLFKAERFAYSSVPTVISDAVTANYSTYTVMRKCELYTMTDSTLKYKVYLKGTDTQKTITFNADATVSCEK